MSDSTFIEIYERILEAFAKNNPTTKWHEDFIINTIIRDYNVSRKAYDRKYHAYVSK